MPLRCKGSKEKIDFSTVSLQSNGSQSVVHRAAAHRELVGCEESQVPPQAYLITIYETPTSSDMFTFQSALNIGVVA